MNTQTFKLEIKLIKEKNERTRHIATGQETKSLNK